MGEEYAVEITATAAGNEYRRLLHPYPVIEVDLDFSNRTETWAETYLRDLYHRSGGRFGGFRWKDPRDYSTNGTKGAPTANDQACLLSGTDYQIIKWYGTESGTDSTRRRLRKLVASTVLVGIRDGSSNPVALINGFTVDDNTGLITFAANNSKAITAITLEAQAEITVGQGHGFVVNDSVHISGVAGMTEINGLRGTIVEVNAFGNRFKVDINSSAFTAFSLASPNLAVVNTNPQTGEIVTAGCEFDIPVRFDSDSVVNFATRNSTDLIVGSSARIVEILNP